MQTLVDEDVRARAQSRVQRDEPHRTIVEEVELAVGSLGDGSVVTAVLRRAHVVDQRYELVRGRRRGAGARLLVEQESIEIELARELDVLRHFPAHKVETLQLDAQHVGRSFDGKLFARRHFTLAFVALVRVVTVQFFATEVVG